MGGASRVLAWSLLRWVSGVGGVAGSLKNESYVTLMYGSPEKSEFHVKELEFACVTAVNGVLLKEFDPERSRICLVNEAISEPVREALRVAWRLVETNMTQPTPPGVDRSRYSFPTWEGADDPRPPNLSLIHI